MNVNLKKIFELESSEKYNEAYSLYKKLILKSNADYEIWKYFFFFLWSMLEDDHRIFTTEIDINAELQTELKNGLKKYSKSADFNFMVGYTISMFPYAFGDYEEFDNKSREMLKTAIQLEPENPIFKMVYIASSNELTEKNQLEYQKTCYESKSLVLEKYNEPGLLNEYFKQVLIRT